ncbi:flavin reductase [Bradyrhizobium retamae]|uniref:flavin reductase n=1 Tax=Bradyrhizobium retamae TaxID=1300035 RepID=UPI0024C03215|nr:flavin reductase [Bradyrhizobium retamae]
MRFAGRHGANAVHRFDTAPWDQGVLDVPVLQSAVCVLESVLHHHQLVGTHGIFIGRIVATRSAQGNPLINFVASFERYSTAECRFSPQCRYS